MRSPAVHSHQASPSSAFGTLLQPLDCCNARKATNCPGNIGSNHASHRGTGLNRQFRSAQQPKQDPPRTLLVDAPQIRHQPWFERACRNGVCRLLRAPNRVIALSAPYPLHRLRAQRGQDGQLLSSIVPSGCSEASQACRGLALELQDGVCAQGSLDRGDWG
jgi:hypothetical protein